jgi:hypothetical protein
VRGGGRRILFFVNCFCVLSLQYNVRNEQEEREGESNQFCKKERKEVYKKTVKSGVFVGVVVISDSDDEALEGKGVEEYKTKTN